MTSPAFPVAPIAVPAVPQPRRPQPEPDPPFDVRVDQQGGVCTVHAAGEVDIATSPLLERALDRALGSEAPTVVVDLREVSFVDCTGIGLLTHARWRAGCRGVGLRILPGRAVARTAALLELTAVLGLPEPVPATRPA